MITVPATKVITASRKKPSSIVKPFDLYVRARMAVLPTATIDDMPREMPMEACARVSLGPVRWISVRGHLEGCLANLWRRTRRYCRSTRHVDTRLLRPPCIGSGGRSCKDGSRITHELADWKNISRVETDAREAAKTIDTIWGANSDSFLAQTDA